MMSTQILKKMLMIFAVMISYSAYSDVKISSLQDFDFGLYANQNRLQDDKNVCVNVLPLGQYRIVMFGDGAGGSFEISNGIDTLPYRVIYNDRPRTQGGRTVRVGQFLTRQSGASDQINCGDGLNANIRIQLRGRDIRRASPGRYRGTLTMTVTPE